jgi:L-histidine Nalpha-methyltransferase
MSTMLPTIADRIATIDRDGEDVIAGLTQSPKTIPAKYFYDDRGSDLFEQICQLPEYYPTRTEAGILQQCAGEIAIETGSCELIELGSGSSTKTRFLLDAYLQHTERCKYIPIDVSGGILAASVEELKSKYPTVEIAGKVGTYEGVLVELVPHPILSTRTIFFLGSSIGNFTGAECDVFLQQVRNALNVGDYFLLGIDLQKSVDILEAAYNDRMGVTAEFNLNILSHLNWRFQGNFDPSLFRHRAIYNRELNQIEMYLDCHQDCTVRLQSLNLELNLAAGESILTEVSRKFDLSHMQSTLATHGIKNVKVWSDPQQWFGLILGRVD